MRYGKCILTWRKNGLPDQVIMGTNLQPSIRLMMNKILRLTQETPFGPWDYVTVDFQDGSTRHFSINLIPYYQSGRLCLGG